MNAFQPYPAYKDSGVEWLGQIPAHWYTLRLKFALIRNDGGVWGEDLQEEDLESVENCVIVLRSTEINLDGSWDLSNPAIRKLSNQELDKSLLKAGDLLITKSSGSEKHLGKAAFVTKEIEKLYCSFSNFMQRLKVSSSHNPKNVFYLLNCDVGKEQMGYWGSTTTGLRNLNATILGEIILPGAPYSEQNAITSFLDRETAQIDTLITHKRELIDLLRQQRSAIISHAVTKGLDANVPMKDSGIEWLGQIPEHWDVMRLKYVTSFVYGDSLIAGNRKDGDVPVYGSNGEVGKHHESNTKNPCIVIGRKGSFGKVNYSEVQVFAIDTTFFIDNTITKVDLRWLYYLLGLLGLDEFSQDSAVPGLNREFAYNQYIPFPEDFEKKDIATFLDRETKRIDHLITEIEASIDLLRQQRTALISAAVTGRIDVRGQA
jgi:type I restriction enzyme, S subunit